MRNIKWNVYIVLGLILIVSALALTFYNMWDDTRANRDSEDALVRLKQVQLVTEPSVVNASADSMYSEERMNAEEIEIPDYQLNEDMEMPSAFIDGMEYVGVIQMPTLGLELPVIAEGSEENLKFGPCCYKGSPYKNDFIVMAHNYRSHFGSLKSLQIEDQVFFTDMDGNEFRYRVVEKEILKASQSEEMVSGDWDLTLFTCVWTNEKRVTVRCVLDDDV